MRYLIHLELAPTIDAKGARELCDLLCTAHEIVAGHVEAVALVAPESRMLAGIVPRKEWTPEEDAKVLEGKAANLSYEEISAQLEGRSRAAVSIRWWLLTRKEKGL